MLDTRIPLISPRSRRSYSSARPEIHSRESQGREPRLSARSARSQTQAAPAREHLADPPVRRALPSAQSSRLSRSEMRLMGAATACMVVACALLLLYLAAYAQVTQLGIAQAAARTDLHRSQLRSQLLQAERNALESPQRITAAAAAQGMVPRGRTPVDYVAVRRMTTERQNASTQENASTQVNTSTQEADAQGNRSGTTEDSRAAAPFGH